MQKFSKIGATSVREGIDIMRRLFFIMFLCSLTASPVYAGLCDEAFSDKGETFSAVESFASAMTKGLILRKGQDSLFDLYVNLYFPYPSKKNIGDVADVLGRLESSPYLSKLPVREQTLHFSIKERDRPESLKKFIASFSRSARRIQDNLFQIEANWFFLAKLLDFPAMPSNFFAGKLDASALNRENRAFIQDPMRDYREKVMVLYKALSKKEKQRFKQEYRDDFMAYLDASALNSETRAFIRDPSRDYREKVMVLYKALQEIKQSSVSDLAKRNLSQTMAELIWTAGFGNPAYRVALADKSPEESLEALRNILNERDIIAFRLGFNGHFAQLKKELRANIPEETKILQQITQDIQNQPGRVKKTEILRLRALSFIESPFRSCLSGDCATENYFTKALDPNFLYFTLTDIHHRSSGHVTVVLGTAETKTGERVNTAFVDQIQNIAPNRLKAVLEGIRLSLEESGYRLGLPEDVGDTLYGLSNEALVGLYVESKIYSNLQNKLKDFEPHILEESFNSSLRRNNLEEAFGDYGFTSLNTGVRAEDWNFSFKVKDEKKKRYDNKNYDKGELNTTRDYEYLYGLYGSEESSAGPRWHYYDYADIAEADYPSRAYDKLLELEPLKLKDVRIVEGEEPFIRLADENLSVHSLYEKILPLADSHKEEDRIKFLNNLSALNQVEDLNWRIEDIRRYLHSVLENKDFSFKLRKKAFFTVIEFEWYNSKDSDKFEFSDLKQKISDYFSSKAEKKALIGEMSSWKKTREDYRLHFIEELNDNAYAYMLAEFKNSGVFDPLRYGELTPLWDLSYMLIKTIKYDGHPIALVRKLLEAGADPNVRDKSMKGGSGWISHGLFVMRDEPHNDGYSLLMLSAGEGRTDTARLLLEWGADVHAKSKFAHNDTALNVSVDTGHKDTALLFLEWGANINEAFAQRTILDEQLDRKNTDMVDFLKSRGAKQFQALDTSY